MISAYIADRIFTGEEWLLKSAVLVEDGIIQSVVSKEGIPANVVINDYKDNILAPCFMDLQIYGAYGLLFGVNTSAKHLHAIYRYCKAGGAAYFQPTVATNSYAAIYECVDAVRDYWSEGGKGVIGLHVEGPWINKEKRGAHVEEFIHSPTVEQAKELLEYGKGVITMITLAPEVCSPEVINLITSYGVIVSAGHSNATSPQAINFFNAGINVATHLFNAMSPLQHRAPGLVGAIMDHSSVRASIVADGYHVDFTAVSIAKKVLQQRLFFITDAVTEINEGYYPHKLEGDKYVANGILSGSALTMAKSVKNAVKKAGIELSEALRMASLYPAEVVKMDNQLGRIAVGYKAEFVVLDSNLEVVSL